MERDGADDALRGQDGAADEQHVRALLAERIDAPEKGNPVVRAIGGVVGSGGRQHGVSLPLDAARDELPEVPEPDDPHPQRRGGGGRRRRGRWIAFVADLVLPLELGRRGEGIHGGEGGRSDRAERREGAEVWGVAAQEADGAGRRGGGGGGGGGEAAGAGEMAERGGHRRSTLDPTHRRVCVCVFFFDCCFSEYRRVLVW